MIKISNLNKKIKNIQILNSINLELPRYGLIGIVGPSGCGKTTLINCISGLTSYDGNINFDNIDLNSLSDNNKSLFRLKNIGLIFQDFKLYENETSINNILLPLEVISNMKQNRKNNKAIDLLNIVNLKNKRNVLVKDLSGGEKQRVAIARALVNDPKIILADEPTGSLDENNSIEIMNILLNISKNSLVVIISHDMELIKKYAERIIEMKNGKIENIKYKNSYNHNIFFPVIKNKKGNKKPSLPFKFAFKHTLHNLKINKWRTLISCLVTSLGLIGVGLSSSISSSISHSIQQTYESVIGDNSLILSAKNTDLTKYGKYSVDYTEAKNLSTYYSEYIKDTGVIYSANFENFFPKYNHFIIENSQYKSFIPGFNIRAINEFKWLEENTNKIYPRTITKLNEDEIILSLNFDIIQNICTNLKIERTIPSLSNYISNNLLKCYLDVANDEWSYSDQQLFSIKGFVVDTFIGIYHSDHLWNEHILEDRMKLTSKFDLDSNQNHSPWTMNKIPYYLISKNIEKFLILSMEDEKCDKYIFEIANINYFPNQCKNIELKDINKVLVFQNNYVNISSNYFKNINKYFNDLKNPIFGCSAGYTIYPTNMMSGFSNNAYLSADLEKINKVIDANSSLSNYDYQFSEMPDGVLNGYFAKSQQNSLKFYPLPNKLLKGSFPKSVDEIVISSTVANKLNLSKIIGDSIYFSYTSSEIENNNGKILKTYQTAPLKVVGVVDNENQIIYHYPYWTIIFFQLRLGISKFDLQIQNVSYQIPKNVNEKELVNKINKAYPKLEVQNPLVDINANIDEVCNWIKIAILIFSSIAIIISIFLLTVSNYISLNENKKDIGLARCLGINKNDSFKFVISNSLITSFLSLFIAIIELFIINFFINYSINQSIINNLIESFNIEAILYMVLVTIILSIISSFLLFKKTTSLNPIDSLKE